MRRAMSVSELSPLVHSRRHLVSNGWTDRSIDTAVRCGELIVIRRGSFMAADDAGRFVAGRATSRSRDRRRRETRPAARWYPTCQQVSSGGFRCTATRPLRVARHHACAGADLERRDVIRHRGTAAAPATSCSATASAAPRLRARCSTSSGRFRPKPPSRAPTPLSGIMAQRGREWDEDAVDRWRRSMARASIRASGARGIRQARWVIRFADGRAQLPGESVSRLQLVRLGFRTPQLQVPVAGPAGRTYFVDFGLDDVHAFGEFDGKDKYLDEAMRRGVPLERDPARGETARGLDPGYDAMAVRPMGRRRTSPPPVRSPPPRGVRRSARSPADSRSPSARHRRECTTYPRGKAVHSAPSRALDAKPRSKPGVRSPRRRPRRPRGPARPSRR